MTTQTITISHRQLVELTRKVLPHVGSDAMLPVLTGMKIETRGRWLIAYATDKFSVGLQRIEKERTEDSPAAEWPTFSAHVGAKDLKALLAHYKPARGAFADLSLTVDGDRLRVETASGGFDLFDSAHTTYRLIDDETYPDIVALVAKNLHASSTSTRAIHGFHPMKLARFAQVGEWNASAEYRFGADANSPMVVLDGAGFVGLLMPRRLLDPSNPIEDWTDLLPAPAAPKAVEA